MSLLSLLAAIVAAKTRQIKPDPPDVEITRLKAQIDDLKRERNEWYGMAVEWRGRYYEIRDRPPNLHRVQSQHPITEEMRQAMMHQSQSHIQSAAQLYQQTMLNQNTQNQHPLLQVQGLKNQVDSFVDGMFCNCVPARHDLFLRR